MSNKRFIFYNYFSFIVFSFLFPNIIKGQGQTESNSYTIYDTIFVYDTIWTYETVYDTVWVYDTIYIDETINDINKLVSKEITPINHAVQEKGLFDDPQLQIQPIFLPDTSEKAMRPLNINACLPGTIMSPVKELTLKPFKKKPVLTPFYSGSFCIEGYSGPTFQQISRKFISENSKDRAIAESTTAIAGIEYGIRCSYNFSGLTLQTGLGLSQLREKFSFNPVENIDSTKQTLKISKTITLSDTILFLNVDEFLEGNTVWTSYIYQRDTLVVTDSIYYQYDTINTALPVSEIVSHNLLEIPLLVSWQWRFSKLKLGFKAGGINQVHLYSKGKAYSGYGSVAEINDAVQFTTYNLALYGGLTCSYMLTNCLSVGFDAYYKYPVQKSETMFNAEVYRRTYGANFSLCYHFKKRENER